MDELNQRIFDEHEKLLKNANEMLDKQQEISNKWEKLAKLMITGINLCKFMYGDYDYENMER